MGPCPNIGAGTNEVPATKENRWEKSALSVKRKNFLQISKRAKTAEMESQIYLNAQLITLPEFYRSHMFSKVRVNKYQLNYFRKIARQGFPNEVQAYLTGKVLSVDSVEITGFHYTPNYAKQGRGEVAWWAEDFNKVKKEAEEENLTILGEMHSHPNFDAIMSPADYSASITQQFVLCGLCSVNRGHTRVRFWTPTSALTCEIIYT